ncbi:MAG: hypothetical protein OEZ32_03775 [Nitrospinota bacterium]|nr:hypothetical protein [Nitrospinota bacterium]
MAVALLLLPLILACSGGDGGGEDTPVDPNATPCGPTQTMPGKAVVWLFYQCEQVDTIKVTPETLDSRTGTPLGDLPMKRGMLSFRYHDLSNYSFGGVETYGVFFKAGGRAHNWEVNWQWLAFSLGAGYIQNELIIQRFDGVCDPKPFCENHDFTMDLQFFSESDVYQWDCWWNTDTNRVTCTVTKLTGDPQQVTLTNTPMGPYNALHYLGVGKNAYDSHTYPSFQGSVSEFKFSVFN